MAKLCRDCEEPVTWCEIVTKNDELKKIAMNPKPDNGGDLTLRNVHRDLPLRAEKWKGTGPKYRAHRDTCSAVDPAERKKYTRDESWVREPEGY